MSRLHPAIEAFLADERSPGGVGAHRPAARAAYWVLPDGGLGVAATAAWMRLVDPDGSGHGSCAAADDVVEAEAQARIDAALRAGERTCVVRRVSGRTGGPARWIEVATWPLTDPTDGVVATAAAASEVPEPTASASPAQPAAEEAPERRTADRRAGGQQAASARTAPPLATPGAPRVPQLRHSGVVLSRQGPR